ncbi:sulfatase [Pedobacter gandavensis]|uniref:Sulfatase-like hydrolase/transferase n=1 Tax=Pedobacter gandavensis TaxID=2679963 RepID=A0ABR6F1G7_9SPHI|nr:sulfatase [Pedobacter gandavensis]MBB2151368.1 sulfatase-like hydrolase/transferase [Pedobacter gandavensis]
MKDHPKKLALLFAWILLSGTLQAQSPKKPNVLFIVSDDLTATAVSAYENKVCKTPNIDKLAGEGTRYTKSYCQYPVCGPSRASMMFGYYPSATKTYGYVSGREHVGKQRASLPELFKNNGYYTARVSKIYHMGIPIDIEEGTDGTDDSASWTEKFNSQAAEWQTPGEAELVQNNPDGKIERMGGNKMTIVKAEGDDLVHADGKTAKTASELIRKHKNEPFFLAVGFVRPHVPFVAPKRYFEGYDYKNMKVPDVVENDWNDIPPSGINYVTSKNAMMNTVQEQKAIAGYYAAVSFMDDQVGKVLKTLKEEGLENNTIVVFISDHGFHLGEHKFWMKVSLHEESVRVPMIIKVPGKQPAVVDGFTELIDLYPTLAELAGLKYSKHIQGKSLVKTLSKPSHTVRDEAFSVSLDGEAFLLRTKEWAYIQYKEDASKGIELYDMINDPKQFNNLAKDPKHLKTIKMLQTRLANKLKMVRKNDLEIPVAVKTK